MRTFAMQVSRSVPRLALVSLLVSGAVLSACPVSGSEYPARADPTLRPDIYVAGTEAIRSDEMRVIALGTGVPAISGRQAATAFLVQLGNGENFIFDIGTGALSNLVQLGIPWNTLDKVFLSHLHFDHIGDLSALQIVGVTHGRNKPLQIWGPSGLSPELGTAYAVERLQEAYTWELTSKRGYVPSSGYEVIVSEFDYQQTQTVYEGNGVKVRAWPAVHVIDGPVSYSLEWNDLKFVFSGDTVPNKWFMQNAADADLLIHEVYIPVTQLVGPYRMKPESAWSVGTRVHTQPAAAGWIFATLRPRMAVVHHFIGGISGQEIVREEIRSMYGGPLSLAEDLMVWNVSSEFITTRQTVGVPLVWPSDDKLVGAEVNSADRTIMSQWLQEGRIDMWEIDRSIFLRLDPRIQEEILERLPQTREQLRLD